MAANGSSAGPDAVPVVRVPTQGGWAGPRFCVRYTEKSNAYYALLRDDRAAEMCARCSVAEKVAMRKKYGVEARVLVVGEVGGVTISDVLSCPVGEPDEKCGAKMVVARTAEGYREILYTTLRQVDGRLNVSFVANAGKDRVLGSRDFVGGNRGIHVEHYFWFDAEGPRLMDLIPVGKRFVAK